MTKGIIIVNYPETCAECYFCKPDIWARHPQQDNRYNCLLENCEIEVDIHEEKESYCDIREIPKKIPKREYTQYSKEYASYCRAYDDGYNDCIDELLGGEE